jgi:DNA-binding transcriptional MerR regulator
MGKKNGLLTTGDMARRTRNTLRTVRFYEEEGLICPVERTRGGHRLFDEDQLHKLALVTDLREVGLALPVIKEVFRIKRECVSASQASHDVRHFLHAQIERMQEQITLFTRLREEFQAAMDTFADCDSCKEDWHRRRCNSCEVMARETLPPNVRMLWLDSEATAANDKPAAPQKAVGPLVR